MRISIRDVTSTPRPLPQYARRRLRRGTRAPGPLPTPKPVDTGRPSAAIAAHERVLADHTRTGGKPHPWLERRKDVIEQFADNILPSVVPHGFTEAWRPDDHEVANTELTWLIATQDKELPPEWLLLRSNGLRGESLDALVETDDGAYSMKDLVADDGHYIDLFEMVHAHELIGGMRRIEEFLRQQDERQWMSGHPRRYYAVVDGQQRRGIVPSNRATRPELVQKDWTNMRDHLGSTDEVAQAMEYREQHLQVTRDQQGKARYSYVPGTFRSREDLAARRLYALLDECDSDRDVADTDFDEEDDDGYSPNTACPNERCEERGEDCTVCQGGKTVLHTIGMDAAADWPPPGWLREPRAKRRTTRRERSRENRAYLDQFRSAEARFKTR